MPAAIAVVGIAASLYSANRASQQQREAMRQSQANTDRAFNFSQQQYEDEKRQKEAAQAPLWAAVNTPGSLDYGLRESNIKTAFQNADVATDQNIANQGLEGSGVSAALKQGNKLEEGKALASAWNQGLIDKRGIAERLAGTYNPTVTGMNASNMAMASARMAADRANQYGNASMAAGNTVGGIMRGLQQLPAGSWDWLRPTQAADPQFSTDNPNVSFNQESGAWNWESPAFDGGTTGAGWSFDPTGMNS